MTAVLSIVGSVVAVVMVEATKLYSGTMPALEASYEAYFATTRVKAEVREMADLASITSMVPTRFTFVGGAGEVLDFEYVGQELLLGGDRLAQNVTNFRFDYWARDGSATADPVALHLVELDLTVERAGRPFRFQTAIFPRCVTP